MVRILQDFRAHLPLLLTVGLVLGGGCKPSSPPADAKIQGIIVLSELGGTANDGDSTTRPSAENYRYRSPESTGASDGASKAVSDAPTAEHVSCNVHAIPGANASEAARAESGNRLETEFDVSKAGAYQFQLHLSIDGASISGNGSIAVFVRGNILSDSGTVLDGGAIAFADLAISSDGKFLKTIADSSVVATADANGTITKTFEGPAKPVTLQPGIYHIGVNLRIDARANDKNAKAEIKNAMLAVSLK